jgi:hypothetical protein
MRKCGSNASLGTGFASDEARRDSRKKVLLGVSSSHGETDSWLTSAQGTKLSGSDFETGDEGLTMTKMMTGMLDVCFVGRTS